MNYLPASTSHDPGQAELGVVISLCCILAATALHAFGSSSDTSPDSCEAMLRLCLGCACVAFAVYCGLMPTIKNKVARRCRLLITKTSLNVFVFYNQPPCPKKGIKI